METARQNWAELDGYAVAHGMGFLQDLPLNRFVNFVWYILTKDASEQDRERLRARLWQPPKGLVVNDPRSPWSAGNESGALSAFKRGMGG